jgi:hypothetical protein
MFLDEERSLGWILLSIVSSKERFLTTMGAL